jgi:hypothetical protein
VAYIIVLVQVSSSKEEKSEAETFSSALNSLQAAGMISFPKVDYIFLFIYDRNFYRGDTSLEIYILTQRIVIYLPSSPPSLQISLPSLSLPSYLMHSLGLSFCTRKLE